MYAAILIQIGYTLFEIVSSPLFLAKNKGDFRDYFDAPYLRGFAKSRLD
jgi:hypothetical protein